jgi:hypothetical protein
MDTPARWGLVSRGSGVEVDPHGEEVGAHEPDDGPVYRRHRALARSWVVVRYGELLAMWGESQATDGAVRDRRGWPTAKRG